MKVDYFGELPGQSYAQGNLRCVAEDLAGA
jgi:hypothetical protein